MNVIKRTDARLALVIWLSTLLPACMKQECYKCTDPQGTNVEEGCNKTREEIKNIETVNNWKCVVLP